MPRRPVVLTAGEAILDVIVGADGRVQERPGGSLLNVAIGLRRLAVPAMLHSQIGPDRQGELLLAHLARQATPITAATRTARPTAVAEARIQADGTAAYDIRMSWDPGPVAEAELPTAALHLGSIGVTLEPGGTAMLALATRLRDRVSISLDANIRPDLTAGRDATVARVEALVALADIAKASHEDLAWLYPDAAVDAVLKHWLDLGAGLAIATLGADGVVGRGRGARVRLAAPTAPVVDTIGAGDSFTSGLLAALRRDGLLGRAHRSALGAADGRTIERELAFASRCAAVTVSRVGADPPRLDELG